MGPLIDFQLFKLPRCWVERQTRFATRPVERPRIDDARRSSPLVGPDMRVTVEQVVAGSTALHVAHQLLVVAVQPADLAAAQLQEAPRFMKGRPDRGDGGSNSGAIGVAVAEDKMGRD